jgi:hypothetical protein
MDKVFVREVASFTKGSPTSKPFPIPLYHCLLPLLSPLVHHPACMIIHLSVIWAVMHSRLLLHLLKIDINIDTDLGITNPNCCGPPGVHFISLGSREEEEGMCKL